MYDKLSKDGYTYYDKGFMLVNKPDRGLGDCIGRTVLAYFCYKDIELAEAVFSCYKPVIDNKGIYLQGIRHPEYTVNDLSRDHVSYTLILAKYLKKDLLVKYFSKYLRWKLSDRYSMTIDFWLWMKALHSKLARPFYYALMIPMIFGVSIYNYIICKLGGFKEVPQDEFVRSREEDLTKKQLRLRKILYPTYAVHNLAHQVWVLPNTLANKLLKKIVLTMVGEENFYLQLLLGKDIPWWEIHNYKPMSSYRWSTRLDKTNDRNLYVLPDTEENQINAIDKDILSNIEKP